MSTPKKDQDLDKALINQIKAQTLIDRGLFLEDDGEKVADYKQLSAATLETMLQFVVTSPKELTTKSVSKLGLYDAVFPHAPEVDSDEAEAAQASLVTKLWNLANVGTTGFVQLGAGDDDRGLILCEAKVTRNKTRREPSRFLTANEKLIGLYCIAPAASKLVTFCQKTNDLLGLVKDRQPGYALVSAKMMEAAINQAVAAMPLANPKVVAELMAQEASEAEAQEKGA